MLPGERAALVIAAVLTGLLAGVGMGLVLQRGQLCFHAAIAEGYQRRFVLVRGWALGVTLAAVGLSALYLFPGTEGLNQGLSFVPVSNVAGGLVIGAGMAVARSCVSGLFYKLGTGMLGALVGIGGWAAGELVARQITVPGPRVLGGGLAGTVPGVLGLPRLAVAVIALAAVALWLWRRPGTDLPRPDWQWGWARTGAGLAVAVVGGWALAGLGGADFGPSSVGAVSSLASGSPNVWLLSFLLGIVGGGSLGGHRVSAVWVRGETPVRYLQLGTGGLLLGAGGWIAGGCNLGHGLSGLAQMNVSSIVVVAAIVTGVGATRRVQRTNLRRTTPA